MNRKDLKEKYNIIGNNDDISLYRKMGEYTQGIGYCGNIKLRNGYALFNKQRYKTVEELDMALRTWEASLSWPVDTYNPLMKKSACLRNRIEWYLTDKLGFVFTLNNWSNKYVRNVGPNCQIFFEIENSRDLDKDTVIILSQYGDAIFRNEVKTAEDAITIISSLVRESILQMSSDMVNLLSIVPETEVPDIQAYIKSNRNIFGFEEIDFKEMMISLLENELKKLKGE